MRNVTDQVDLTRIKPESRESPELWRLESGQESSKISRQGLVKTCSQSRGPGRVRLRRLELIAGRVRSARVGQDRSDPTFSTRENPHVSSLASMQTRRVTCLLCFFSSHERFSCTGQIVTCFIIFESGYVGPPTFPLINFIAHL